MSIDHDRVLAFHGVCGYDDWRKQPGRLGWGVGTNGYLPMVQKYLMPLVNRTGCRRIFLHSPFPNNGEKEMPLDAPIRLKQSFPEIYKSFTAAFGLLAHKTSHIDDFEVIQYHGAATQFTPFWEDADSLSQAIEYLAQLFELANLFQHSIALDLASSLKAHQPMALLMPVLSRFMPPSGRRRIYMEQRRSVDQPFMRGIPTITLYSEFLRQEDRGGEPSLAPFDKDVENIIAMDVAPPDRDPLEGWDPWIVDQVEAFQASGFSVAVPTHSMVRRERWDLLEQLFGEPASESRGVEAKA
ncbi:MAG TPA: hypothetical protein VK176_11645 [Phycisphaerales bacterium]|nr:hypothetical protein [Phycisphaerales bacterium]